MRNYSKYTIGRVENAEKKKSPKELKNTKGKNFTCSYFHFAFLDFLVSPTRFELVLEA